MNPSGPTSINGAGVRNRLLVLFLGAVVAALACFASVATWRAYVATHPLQMVWSALHTTIRNGDSLADLEQHLGEGERLSAEELPAWLQQNAKRWPAGFREGDQFYRWQFENYTLHFQFRDDRLINHNPADFADPNQAVVGIE